MEDYTLKDVAEHYWNTNSIDKYLPEDKREEYNKEPVYWCALCGSLAIVNIDTTLNSELTCYCAECGCTNIVEGTIEEWEKLYKK